jgi:hypothetical protein
MRRGGARSNTLLRIEKAVAPKGGRADEAAAVAARVAEEAEERVHPLPLPGLGVDVKPADPGRHSFGASAARR